MRSTCQRVVFGEGNPQAAILFVGEAPGAQEDEQGKPFVGAAGQLLSRIFDAVGLARDEVFITNTVMCRPPNNRLPQPDEVFACRPYLETKVRLLRPKIIVALGALATKSLIDPSQGITRIRGQWFEKDGIKLTATFHPAALLRDPGKKRPVWEDFKSLVEVYRRLR
ncbi:MAG: uracil-DNA glycosylase [Firmicutes bacterium]|nr:uracil-DNA glycosylase [Bacillota bacterium]